MRYLKNKSGFTLIEVIIAFAILGVVMVAFLGLFTAGHMFVYKAGTVSGQVYDAQAELDQELSGATGDLTVHSTPNITFRDAGGATIFTLPMTRYQRNSTENTVLEMFLP